MEPILFFLTAYSFVLLAFGRRAVRQLRDSRRERHVRALAVNIIGRSLGSALRDLGQPFAVFEGSGRTLYEWKSPPARSFPGGSGLLIFYVVADSSGVITQSFWQTRTEEAWRSSERPSGSIW